MRRKEGGEKDEMRVLRELNGTQGETYGDLVPSVTHSSHSSSPSLSNNDNRFFFFFFPCRPKKNKKNTTHGFGCTT